MPLETLLTVLMWVLWLGIAVQFALAVNGYVTELREGMTISFVRLGMTAGAFVMGSLLLVAVLLLPRTPMSVAPIPKPVVQGTNPAAARFQAESAEIRKKLAALQDQQSKLDQQRGPLQSRENEIEKMVNNGGQKPPFFVNDLQALEGIDRRTRLVLVLTALAALLFAGLAGLAFGGQLQTLFPGGGAILGRRNLDSVKLAQELDAIAALVWAENYRDALARTESVPSAKLRPFDQLDFFFLRGYCALQIGAFDKETTDEERTKMFESAVRDLEIVAEQAPKRGEVVYALAVAYGLSHKPAEALRAFEQARKTLPEKDLPFDHNQSVCLLRLAEASLSAGNTEEADSCFARVATLGKLGSSVVQSRIRIGMIDLRGALNKHDMASASVALEKIVGLGNLSDDQRSSIGVMASALNARIALRRNDAQQAFDECGKFLSKHLPSGLPPLDDQAADEPFSPILEDDLPFPRGVFQGFLFIQAVALSRLEAGRRARPGEAETAQLAEPLLRILQIVPRQRDALGALGCLYYWLRQDKRDKAREWLEGAVSMGAPGRIIRAILERDRQVEMERREALDWFRSASSRFLRDPALAGEVRRALVEELGRFQEFEPLLISLREKPEVEEEEPTIQGLRDRAGYLAGLVASVAAGGQSERFTNLAQIQGEYSALLLHLEQTSQNISTLERRVFAELAGSLALK